MDLSASGCFHIDSLLSLRSDPARLSPCSGGSAPPSPRRALGPRLESPPPPGLPRPRRAAPSFLIRDILADCGSWSDPGLVCSDPGPPEREGEPPRAGGQEDFQNKGPNSWSSDGENTERGVEGPSVPSGRLKKPRKARTAFSEQQLSRLERSFQRQKYLSVQDRVELTTDLQLSHTQVKTWYQNRRTKWKRQSSGGLEFLVEGGRIFLPARFPFPPAPPTLDLRLYRGHAHHHHQAPDRTGPDQTGPDQTLPSVCLELDLPGVLRRTWSPPVRTWSWPGGATLGSGSLPLHPSSV